jgi:hypothetical protein
MFFKDVPVTLGFTCLSTKLSTTFSAFTPSFDHCFFRRIIFPRWKEFEKIPPPPPPRRIILFLKGIIFISVRIILKGEFDSLFEKISFLIQKVCNPLFCSY